MARTIETAETFQGVMDGVAGTWHRQPMHEF